MLNFNLTDEQRALKVDAANFARRVAGEDMEERERHGRFSHSVWEDYAGFGVQGLIVPQAYGGQGRDFISCVAVMEGLGYGSQDNGILFSINAHIWSCIVPILRFGNERQREKYLPGLCDGSLIGVHAMTEKEAGSDAFSLQTRAEKIAGGYVLNGDKTFITNGNIADLILVYARSADQGAGPLSCILVESQRVGLSRSDRMETMGLRTVPFCQLTFSDCEVPQENLIGREGDGKQIFSEVMDGERAFILATQVGAMEKQLESCVEYARKRRQFGKAIFDFQSVSNALAEMKVRLENSRLQLYNVAWLKARERNATQASAMAKYYISESRVQNSLAAMRILGGTGYTVEAGQERQLRDALGGLFYSGTSEIMRNIIAELLD